MKTILLTFAAATLIIAANTPRAAAQAHDVGKTTDATPNAVDTAAPTKTEATTHKSETELEGVTAELLSVTRTDGDTVTIKFKYSNGGQKKANLGYYNLATLIYYIDGKNRKKYSVMKDTAGDFISSSMSQVTLEPGGSKSGWSKLPAPPPDITTITVFLPATPPFEGVKIQR